MPTVQLLLPGKIVKKSNAIARARWHPGSVWEPRLVALVASKVRKDDEDFQTYRIPVAELAGEDDKNLDGKTYQDIKKALLRIVKATIYIQGEGRNFMAYPVFSKCGYENGCLVADFHPDLKPHFLSLKTHFTEFNLFEYLRLPSTYSQRLFEILKSWSDKPEVVLSVAELHEILGTPESFRKNFAAFRRKVLEQAHKDIIKKTSLRYEWEPIKKGRAVVDVRFLIGRRLAIEAKASEAQAKAEARRSAANDKAFKAFVVCRAERGQACEGGHQKAKVCELCRTFRPIDKTEKQCYM